MNVRFYKFRTSCENFTFSSTYISLRVKKKNCIIYRRCNDSVSSNACNKSSLSLDRVRLPLDGSYFFFLLKHFYFTFNNLRLVIFTTIRTASVAVALASAAATTFVCSALVYRKADNNYTGQHLRKMRRSAGSHDRCPMACLQMDGEKKINNIIFS